MQASALSDVGSTRSKNEDAYWCDVPRGVFIVADGIGSQQAGEVASTAAVEVISAELTLAVDRGLRESELADAMFDAFRESAEEIYNRAKESEQLSGMACSAIAAVVMDGYCHGGLFFRSWQKRKNSEVSKGKGNQTLRNAQWWNCT